MNKTTAIELHESDAESPPDEMFVNGELVTEEDVLDAIDKVIKGLYTTSDLHPVDSTLNSLLGIQNVAGKSLAKLLWGTKQWWVETGQEEITGDTFEDYIETMHGLKKIHTQRYVSVWSCYEKRLIPKDVRGRPMKDQIAIAKTIEQGYDIDEKAWKKIRNASNNNEVLAILRKVKGKPPRKSSLQVFLERDGNINAWDANGKHFIGYLNVKEEDDDEAIKKAITRIVNSSGMQRR